VTALPAALAGALPLFGDVGRRWQARLPEIVDAACERWQLSVGPPYEPGGVCSWVAPATKPDGSRVVLKITVPHEEAAAEVAGLRAWGGDGAVTLLAADEVSWTLLLEELGSSLEGESPDTRYAVLADLVPRLWRGEPMAFPRLSEIVGDWPEATAAEMLDPAWDEGLVRGAADAFTRLVQDPVEPVLLHGDLHAGNVLAKDGGWAAIDPKPMVGDPAYDLRQVIRSVAEPTAAATRATARRLEAATGVPAGRSLAWSYVLGMTSAVWSLEADPAQAAAFYAEGSAAAEALSSNDQNGPVSP
jgi:streptomycin 6-kinase